MTGSWLIVKWAVVGAAGLCVGALLIVWMIEGAEFVCEKPGQKMIFAFAAATWLSSGSASRFSFALAGLIYAGLAIVLLRVLAKKGRVWLKADS